MIITNLTSNPYYLGSASNYLAPLGTLTLSDSTYNSDDAVASQVNTMYSGGVASVTNPPLGFPRTVSGGSSGASVTAGDVSLVTAMQIFA